MIASNPTALASAGIYSGALGPFTGRLGNDGETLQLFNNSGRLMNEVDYGDGGDWPVGPDGSGFTLAKLDPYTSSSDGSQLDREPAIQRHAGRGELPQRRRCRPRHRLQRDRAGEHHRFLGGDHESGDVEL